MRKIAKLLAAGVVAAAVPMAAQAVTFVTVSATPYDFATPAGLTAVTFDGALPAGVTLTLGTNAVITSGSTIGIGAAPATGPASVDTTNYLSVYSTSSGGGTATLNLANLSNFVSLYWGSIDSYNSIQLLLNNAVVENVAAPPPATGSQTLAATNARVNISSTSNFNGIRFISSGTAFEIDNVGIGAVPEAATWMMMLAGFGMMGFAMRRRPRTAVTFG